MFLKYLMGYDFDIIDINANVVFSAIVFLVEQIVYHAFCERLVFSPVIASQLFQTLFHIVVGAYILLHHRAYS